MVGTGSGGVVGTGSGEVVGSGSGKVVGSGDVGVGDGVADTGGDEPLGAGAGGELDAGAGEPPGAGGDVAGSDGDRDCEPEPVGAPPITRGALTSSGCRPGRTFAARAPPFAATAGDIAETVSRPWRTGAEPDAASDAQVAATTAAIPTT
ncbi:MAG: hypothetical protein M0T72_01090, partial [Candidatus Dormibacteraeota bacterium]|nr:hypothetical protein [Candidatus Dormibacteraeota bacterium]